MEKSENWLSLHRYFIYANRMRELFKEERQKPKNSTNQFIYMSYWYASLNCVIEGWKEIKLKDVRVNLLLNSANVELLKDFRHSVMHYQTDYTEQRILKLMRNGEDVVNWVHDLHLAFSDYFFKGN